VHYRTNVYTATDDCNNSVTCRQVLKWREDRTPPVFTTCPADVDLGCNPASISACNVADVVATDDCGAPTVTCASFDAPVVSCVHYRTNVYTATDDCNNSVICRQVLKWREDTTPPVFTTCPDKDLGCNPASIPACNVVSVVATDECGAPIVTCASFNGPVVGCVHYRTNVYTATDACNNRATCRQVLSWTEDVKPPVINCPLDIVGDTDMSQCSKSNVTYSVMVTDNCLGVAVACTPPSGSTFAQGTNTVICTATDCGSNTVNCSFRVIIQDSLPPAINCPPNILGVVDAGQGSKSNVTYRATATDNCPGVVVACTPPSGSTFAQGTNTVICIATDARGHSNSCSFTITIVSLQEAPILSVVRQGQEVMICWPKTGMQVLQETADLSAPIRWSPVTAAVSVIGDKYCVTLAIDSANRFFTLSDSVSSP
jgi:hypothetical protein